MPKQGDKAPDFKLPDQDGKIHHLSDFKGKWVLVYFYPKDFTPGCNREAASFRDFFPDYEKIKAVILGISVDSVESHKKFADYYKLPFTILSDSDKKVVKKYGVWQKKRFLKYQFYGTLRTSFLVNPQGKITKVYEKVNPIVHAKQVLKDLKTFEK